MTQDERIMEEAAAWHLASADDSMDWDGFTSWLEADPRNRLAFDQLALTDAALGDHLDLLGIDEVAPATAPERAFRGAGWARWSIGAIAASLALVLGFAVLQPAPDLVYHTGTQQRQIALEDGSTITLAPRSELRVSADDTHLNLAGGAWFAIRHDPARSLTISAGPLEVRDIGTQFDIQTDPGHVRIGVAEGRIEVGSAALSQPLRMAAGKELLFDSRAGRATLTNSRAKAIGTWRQGQLTYDSAPLSLVVSDLNRYAGLKVDLADSLKDRRFSGTLASSDGQVALRDLSQLMALELESSAGGYRLGEPAH